MADDAGFTIADPQASDGEQGGRTSQRDLLVETALEAGITFWRDPDGNAFATVPWQDRIERYPVRSRRFGLLVRALYGTAYPVQGRYGSRPGSVSDNPMREALAAFEAMAMRGEIRVPEVRILRQGAAILLDLGDESWRFVHVTAEKWHVVPMGDVPLIRPHGMRALPLPCIGHERRAAMASLRSLLNVASDRDLLLIVAWLVATLYPEGPYPVLALDGEQGSAKSLTCRMLRRLVDPNLADLRAPPRREDDLLVAAQASRVVVADNVSSIDAELADAICRLATGAGLSKRRLYTNAEEHIVSIARPVLLNGIPSLLARGDLADRALAITLPHIPDHRRRPEKEIWRDFEAAAPGILGLLLDGLVMGVRRLPEIKLDCLPRMADFTRLACAAAPAFGWTDSEMLDAIESNRECAVAAVVEADPLAEAVREIAVELGLWQGTATTLLSMVNNRVPPEIKNERSWPKDGARLSTRLKRVQPALRRTGLEIDNDREGGSGRRLISIRPIADLHPPSPASPASQVQFAGGLVRDGHDGMPAAERHTVSQQESRNPAVRDTGDARDADPESLGGWL